MRPAYVPTLDPKRGRRDIQRTFRQSLEDSDHFNRSALKRPSDPGLRCQCEDYPCCGH